MTRDEIRAEETEKAAVEMAAVIEDRVAARFAQERESLVSQRDQLQSELDRVNGEIAELTPVEVVEEVAEEVEVLKSHRVK